MHSAHAAEQAAPLLLALQMSLRGMGGKWKPVELFEREARLLRSLSHPGIPALLDSFEIDSATDRVYVLVQQLAPGATLQSLVDSRAWRPDEPEIEAIALRLLDVLSYLHARRPPVVHRDLKPSNVLYDRASGMVTLVDFGAVRDGINADGSTMIGTFGFMPPEQARCGMTRRRMTLQCIGFAQLTRSHCAAHRSSKGARHRRATCIRSAPRC